MSRIFDALAKSTGGVTELARKWLPQVPLETPQVPADADGGDAAQPSVMAAAAIPEAAQARSVPSAHTAEAPAAVADEAEVAEPAEAGPSSSRKPRLVEWRPPLERNGGSYAREWEKPAPVRRESPKTFPVAESAAVPAHDPFPAPAARPAPASPATERHESGLVLHLPKPAPPPVAIRNLPVTAASSRPILPFDLGDSVVNEGYRKIRTQLLQVPSEPRVIVISSPSQGDGKTLTSINLAGALALKHDINCVLVDADLRRGDVAASCGLPEGPGLGDYLGGRCRLEDTLIRVQQLPNLFVITSGEYRANPVELLDSPRWLALLDSLRQRFRFVIIDVPPMGSLADYDLVEAASDGVILVVRQDHTTRTALHSALQSVPAAKRLGIIMNSAVNPAYARRGGYGNYPPGYTMGAGR